MARSLVSEPALRLLEQVSALGFSTLLEFAPIGLGPVTDLHEIRLGARVRLLQLDSPGA